MAFRSWDEYLAGFGNTSEEFWVGNEHLHFLLLQGRYALRVETTGYTDKLYWAQYSSFSIADEADNYRCSVSGFSGNYLDTMESTNGAVFATYDKSNGVDFYFGCESIAAGGWWVNTTAENCGNNLNEPYSSTPICMNFSGRCMRKSEMKVILLSAIQH